MSIILKNIKIFLLIFFLISMVLSFSSCAIFKSKKHKTKNEQQKQFQVTLKNINLHELKYKTFYSTFSGKFKNDNINIPLKGILKIKKDTFISISFRPVMGIELAKILLTKDSIKIIDKTKHEFILEDYKFVENKFGYILNFETIQSILTNKFFIYPLNEELTNYTISSKKDNDNKQNFYYFSNICKINEKKAKHTLKFAQNDFNLKSNNFNSFDNLTFINILYSDFNEINKSKFPKKIEIKLAENEIKNNILISYKNIKLNKSLNDNFVVPKNYKPVKFEK